MKKESIFLSDSIKGIWKTKEDTVFKFDNKSVIINSIIGLHAYPYKIEEGNKLYIPGWWHADEYYTINQVNDEKIELISESGDVCEVLIKK